MIILFPAFCAGQVARGYEQLADKVNLALPEGRLSISPLTDNAVRIQFLKDADVPMPELVLTSGVRTPGFVVSDVPPRFEVRIRNMVVAFDKQDGTLSFESTSGEVFLSEKAGTRKLVRDSVMGTPCFLAEQTFESPAGEYLFGLGQFQDGHYNVRGISRRLTQVNSQIAIPFVYSTKGYGLLWHQYGLTDFNPADNAVPLEKQVPSSGEGKKTAQVTTASGTVRISQNETLYVGTFVVRDNGVYSVFLDLGDMGNRQYVAIDGKPCIDESNAWLPPTAGAPVHLEPGEHRVEVVCSPGNTPAVSWARVNNVTTFRSPNAKSLDYVVVYGPSADSVIATYRKLSGDVPLLPRWAYGFWQCRERYTSGKNLVETVEEFRKRNIPVDVIVQDWQYWGTNGWGVPQFDSANYSNPAGFISRVHNLDAHFSISIWSNPDKNSAIGKEYVAKNLYVPDSKWLDYFNPVTRETYWNTLNDNLFSCGVDSWWMDATEPENDALHGKKTFMGPGDCFRLTYPLFVSRAVFEGQRKTTSDKRVCILTRSAFLGQQRYGTINWSGDIGGTWDSYRRQIVAGLDYTITGLPYWTTDIGGFFRPGPAQYSDDKYRELLTRWCQWGAFNPIFRVHGYQSETEPWKYGEQVERTLRTIVNLRYRLLPYIYSEAWQITGHGSTMMRPLVMDFRQDTSALNQSFEYMFGKAFLVAPVTEPAVHEWNVYLPGTASWYDFWTGKRFDGCQTTNVAAPLDRIPLMVRAGSIIPMGPFIQYSTERSDPIELRIYRGADADFTLYEDENDGYEYERGRYSTIEFRWNDRTHILAIGKRHGDYPGMIRTRTFRVVVVSPGHGTGVDTTSNVDTVVNYDGNETRIALH